MTTEHKITRSLVRLQKQVAHKSPAQQTAFLTRREADLRNQAAIHQERRFVRAVGFHSDGSPTLGQLAFAE